MEPPAARVPQGLRRSRQQIRRPCRAVPGRRHRWHYFGYPAAQEHAAERAVRAGLEIAAAVGRLKRPDGEALRSRVGIATGLVAAGTAGVVGEQTVVGDAPNLAARLQSFAEPGCVLVGPATHRLTEAFFGYKFVGEHEVEGISRADPYVESARRSRHREPFHFCAHRGCGPDPRKGTRNGAPGRCLAARYTRKWPRCRTLGRGRDWQVTAVGSARRALAGHAAPAADARNVPRITATLCCTQFWSCYVTSSICGGI